MKILLTGHAGFIGQHLFEAFENEGHEVHGYDLQDGGKDIRNWYDVLTVFEYFQPDVVCHQAAFTSVPASLENPRECYSVNVMGTLDLLEACRRVGTPKFVFASSCGVYGPSTSGIEESSFHPMNPYTASKAAAEFAVEQSGLNYAILRYTNVYGPGMLEAQKTSVVAKFLASDGPVTVHQSPSINQIGTSCERDFVHIKDVAHANIYALDGLEREALNVGSGISLSVRSVADLLGKPSVMGPMRPGDLHHVKVNIEKFRNRLGDPVDPRDGLPQLRRAVAHA